MRALITGATGFAGSHLTDFLLAKGVEVKCIYRKSSNLRWLENKPVELIEASLSNQEQLEKAVMGVDYIYHVGGQIGARNYEEYFQSNVIGTRNLLEAAYKVNPDLKRFVYVSSQTASGVAYSYVQPKTEEMECRPNTAYAKSKLAAENEVMKFSDKLPVSIVRPTTIMGPRDEGLLPIFKIVNSGIFVIVGFGTKYFSLIHAVDLAEFCYEVSISVKTVGQIYFAGSEEIYEWVDIVSLIKKHLGKKKTLKVHIPHSLLLMSGGVIGFFGKFSKKPPVFNYDKALDFSGKYWTCSIDKAKRDFGYKQKYLLEEMVKDTALWYKNNNWV